MTSRLRRGSRQQTTTRRPALPLQPKPPPLLWLLRQPLQRRRQRQRQSMQQSLHAMGSCPLLDRARRPRPAVLHQPSPR